jgi:hypothetical protein
LSSEIVSITAWVTSSKWVTCLWRAAGRLSLKRRLTSVGMSRCAARFSTAMESVPSSMAIPSQTRIGRLAK